MKNAVIFFTKAPLSNFTKTRLLDFLTPAQAVKLHKRLISDINEKLKGLQDADIFVFFTPKNKERILKNLLGEFKFYPQSGGDLGERMLNAFKQTKALGYDKILLIGSDIANLTQKHLEQSFKALDSKDAVVIPTLDGGYCAMGLRLIKDEVFSSDYSVRNSVFSALCAKLDELGMSYKSLAPLRDIDTKEDIFSFILDVKSVKPLANGEYNINYEFKKAGLKQVFRINTKSQTGLKNQIKYEFDALKILAVSEVTPKPVEYFAPSVFLPRGAITMEFLNGRALKYESDTDVAAYLLSKIHAVKIPEKHHFIVAKKPLLAMYEECTNMANVYLNSEFACDKASEHLLEFLKAAKNLDLECEIKDGCIINTELNSRNFIIGDTPKNSFVIDWEKPIIGEREQDLAHFLAPTTTFWKTDVILGDEEMINFIKIYENYSKTSVDKAKFRAYLAMTCLRGTSWCAMAYTEYQGRRAIKNEFTYQKIKRYLSSEFLSNLAKFFKEFL